MANKQAKVNTPREMEWYVGSSEASAAVSQGEKPWKVGKLVGSVKSGVQILNSSFLRVQREESLGGEGIKVKSCPQTISFLCRSSASATHSHFHPHPDFHIQTPP